MVPPRILADNNEVPPDVAVNIQDEAESSYPSKQQAPLDPIMGVFIEQNLPGSGKWKASMGGKSNSGLDASQSKKSTPFHYRRPTDNIKGFKIRSTVLTTKIKQQDDI